jgi:alkylresorcinol/alkylpyrone synthase
MYVSQAEVFAFFEQHGRLSPEQRKLHRRLLLDGPIRGRYIGMERLEEALETDPDRAVRRFEKFGRRIASKAARKALASARVTPAEVGLLVVNSCTGYLCPGLSSYVAEDIGLPASVKTLDLMGMGCGAAIPNLECAAAFLAAGLERPALSIAVEICTATIFLDDDPGLTVSNCIFGDGAAAAVLRRADDAKAGAGVRLIDFASGLHPQHRNQLRYRTEQGRLRNVLGKRVPVIAAQTGAEVTDRLLARHRLKRRDIRWWAVHAGGSAVLERIGDRLGLDDDALRFSHEIFAEYGNMSSPTVLFVLKRILERGQPRRGDRGVLLSFGAGFTAFGALVEFG